MVQVQPAFDSFDLRPEGCVPPHVREKLPANSKCSKRPGTTCNTDVIIIYALTYMYVHTWYYTIGNHLYYSYIIPSLTYLDDLTSTAFIRYGWIC